METINLHIGDRGSWRVLGEAFVRGLARHRPVALIDPPPRNDWMENDFSAFAASLPPVDPRGLTLNLAEWRKSPALPGRKVLSFIAWETSSIPRPDLELMRTLAEIWVPTRWQRDLFIRNGVPAERLRVQPLGYDPERFHPSAAVVTTPAPRSAARPFRFLFVGKWEKRKGVTKLIKAFAQEFSPRENVELLLAAHNPFVANHESRLAAEFARELSAHGFTDRRIRLLPPRPEAELPSLYRDADAFVLPTRAEGWGLPLLEAMACGLPCIVTRYSAVTEFASDDTVFFLRHRPWLERVIDPSNFDPALDWGGWARPSVRHLRSLFRRVVNAPDSAAAKGRAAALAARENWTWDHAIAKALAHLDAAGPSA